MFAALLMAKTFTRSRRAWRRVGRNAVLWVSLVSFALVAGGAPLPEAPSLGRAGPYPCQGHRCGCRSAEDCWRGCCCFSQQQKLAWARQNGVTPPAYVKVTAAKDTAPPAKSCCSGGGKTQNCCSLIKRTPKSGDDAEWSLALQRAKCRGAATDWLSLGACLPLLPPGISDALPETACAAIENEWTLSPVYRPAAPPPRSL